MRKLLVAVTLALTTMTPAARAQYDAFSPSSLPSYEQDGDTMVNAPMPMQQRMPVQRGYGYFPQQQQMQQMPMMNGYAQYGGMMQQNGMMQNGYGQAMPYNQMNSMQGMNQMQGMNPMQAMFGKNQMQGMQRPNLMQMFFGNGQQQQQQQPAKPPENPFSPRSLLRSFLGDTGSSAPAGAAGDQQALSTARSNCQIANDQAAQAEGCEGRTRYGDKGGRMSAASEAQGHANEARAAASRATSAAAGHFSPANDAAAQARNAADRAQAAADRARYNADTAPSN